jgi:Ca2+ transporting ATPase
LAIGLKECGHVVAVAGNGTNDTYALRKADVSISMGLTCNDTAKEASDIVILDDKFSSIIKTIKWGRHTLATIKKFLILQLTINLVAAVMALLGAVFVGESPLNPMQMLWINLIIDLLGSLSLIL